MTMKMSSKENGLEVKVGLFLCFGLLIIAAMILEFGLGGKQSLFKKYYALQVELPDANGLLKNSEVQLSGARVGYVADKPVLSSNLSTVRVTLKIDENVKIPVAFLFEVQSSGLLGDKYVSIEPYEGFDAKWFNPGDPTQVYAPAAETQNITPKVYDPADPEQNPPKLPHPAYAAGDVIIGVHKASLSDVVSEAEPAVKELKVELLDLEDVTLSLKNGILSESNQKNVEETIGGLNTLVKNAQEPVEKANAALATAQEALETVRQLVDKASHGDGLIGQLVNNRQLADNFNALVINLREHGVLFYKNSAPGNQPSATPAREKKQH